MKRIKGYYVHASIDERRSGRVRGPFKDKKIANLKCDGAGWYGSPGEVVEAEFFEVDGELYEVSKPVCFLDDKEKLYKKTVEDIREKLTDAQWNFIRTRDWEAYDE